MTNRPWQIIAELESNNSKLFKESIIEREAKRNNTEFFQGLYLAYNAMITFGIARVPEKTTQSGAGLDWSTFAKAAAALSTRQTTGHAARDLVANLMQTATAEEWNGWYRRILIKDMRAGFGETTVNKVCKKQWPNFLIPVFECQLAHDSANHEHRLTGLKLVETKLDGVRVITVVYPNGRVDQYSRNGKELANFPHIRAQFAQIADKLVEPTVFDGEIMSGSFQDLMKQIHRKDNVEAGDAVLHLFDFLPLRAFEQGQWSCAQSDRSVILAEWKALHATQTPNIQVLAQQLVDLDSESGQAQFARINADAVAGGYEGIMIKDPAAAYECKRSVNWLKLKPFIEVSLVVTAVEEGTGKNAGRLGALVCEGVDDGKTIYVNVGSGFTDNHRSDYWTNKDSLIGAVVEVRADAVTQNQDGTYSLRFPRFKTFRGFGPGEKL